MNDTKLNTVAEIIIARAARAKATVEHLPSPCISVCRMNPLNDLCEGCFRTLDEIRHWSESDDATKRALWIQIEQRATASLT